MPLPRRTFLQILGLAPALPLAARLWASRPKVRFLKFGRQLPRTVVCCNPEYEAALKRIMAGKTDEYLAAFKQRP